MDRKRARELAVEILGLAEDVEEALDLDGYEGIRWAANVAAVLESRLKALEQEMQFLERLLSWQEEARG